MKRAAWSSKEIEEHDQLLDEACKSPLARDRIETFLAGIEDGIQAHRKWAKDVERTIRSTGAGNYIKTFRKQYRSINVAFNGKILTKPAERGTTEIDDEGQKVNVRKLFYTWTFDQIRTKRGEYLKQIRSYTVDVATMDRLLAMVDLAPDAATPEDAAKTMRTTVEAWLLDEVSA